MQLSKKKVVGLGGLALVAGLTAVAANVPAGAISASGAVNIVVEVYSINYSTTIESPMDGATYEQPVVKFKETHARVDNVKYYLTNTTTGVTYELSQYEVTGDDVSGTVEFTLDLDDYGGYGTYIFRSAIVSHGSHFDDEDSVQFVYASPESPNVPNTGSNNLGAFYGSLNIAKSDLLTTGLIGFLAISLLALFVIRKSSKTERK
ncbi:hypothetical protein IJG79_01155 [Candidatus Saccharibacteria bacterium]|nr:hypothetical protein [Candidatus Saccharibacteria bacterium]